MCFGHNNTLCVFGIWHMVWVLLCIICWESIWSQQQWPCIQSWSLFDTVIWNWFSSMLCLPLLIVMDQIATVISTANEIGNTVTRSGDRVNNSLQRPHRGKACVASTSGLMVSWGLQRSFATIQHWYTIVVFSLTGEKCCSLLDYHGLKICRNIVNRFPSSSLCHFVKYGTAVTLSDVHWLQLKNNFK